MFDRVGKSVIGLQWQSHRLRGFACVGLLLWMGSLAPADDFEKNRLSLGRGWFVSATFSGDGKYVLTASYYKVAQLWDVQTGKEVRRFAGHSEVVTGAVFSPDGKHIVTAAGREDDMSSISTDNSARLWNVATGKEIARCTGHDGYLHSAVVSRDGKRILTASRDATARVWDAQTGKELLRLSGLEYLEPSVSFNPDGLTILGIHAGDGIYHVRLWSAKSGRELRRFEGHTRHIRMAMFSPNGEMVLAASRDGTARIWDTETGQAVQVFKGHRNAVKKATFSADGKKVMTASEDGTARLWDVESGNEIKRFKHPGPVKAALLSRHAKRMLTKWNSSDDNVLETFVSLWDIDAAKEIKRLTLRPGSEIAIFSPDGMTFLATLKSTTLCDPETGKVIRRYE